MNQAVDLYRMSTKEPSDNSQLDYSDVAQPVSQKPRIEKSKEDHMAKGLPPGKAMSPDQIAKEASDAKVESRASAEDIKKMNVDELCEWLKPKLDEQDSKHIIQVI